MSLEEILRRIRESETPRPSVAWSRLSTRRATQLATRRSTHRVALGNELRGDLDQVVLTATAKERSRRYPSSAALAEDIRRVLAHRPVTARPPSRVYHLRLFVRRNRAPVLACAAVGVALIAGTALNLWLDAGTRAALDVVEAREAEILQLSDLTRLAELREELPHLLTLARGKRPALEGWIARARALTERLAAHRRAAEELERARSPSRAPPGAPELEGAFAPTVDAWRHRQLGEIVAGLTRLTAREGQPGSISRVESWLELAPPEPEIDRRWDDAIRSVADPRACPRYGGLAITRVDGWIPLGQDPVSGLWEFVDGTTGLLPRRRSGGGWRLEAETGVVMVLVPGGEFLMGSPAGERWRVENALAGTVRPEDARFLDEALRLVSSVGMAAGPRSAQLARELEAAEREAFLARECGDDRSLRQEVERLLASDPAEELRASDAGDGSGAPAAGDGWRGLGESTLLGLLARAPELAGPYRIVRFLAEGGMGDVYLARQTEPVAREVALRADRRLLARRDPLRAARRGPPA